MCRDWDLVHDRNVDGVGSVQVLKRIAGVVMLLLAIVLLVVGLGGGGPAGNALDDPEASGRLLGILIPVVLFAAVGVWLLLGKRQTK